MRSAFFNLPLRAAAAALPGHRPCIGIAAWAKLLSGDLRQASGIEQDVNAAFGPPDLFAACAVLIFCHDKSVASE